MNPLFSSLLGVAVRASLVQHGTLTSDQATQLASSQTVEQVLGGITMALPIIYSMFAQAQHIREKMAAAKLPSDATHEEIRERAAQPDIRARDFQQS